LCFEVEASAQRLERPVRGPVVDEDHLVLGVCLPQEGVGRGDHHRLLVVDGGDDGDGNREP